MVFVSMEIVFVNKDIQEKIVHNKFLAKKA